MAAEAAAASSADIRIDVYDVMPSVGRKFLMAGKGGLNLTHAESPERFLARFGVRQAQVAPWLDAFGPAALREWAHGLGIETFIGSSQRVMQDIQAKLTSALSAVRDADMAAESTRMFREMILADSSIAVARLTLHARGMIAPLFDDLLRVTRFAPGRS